MTGLPTQTSIPRATELLEAVCAHLEEGLLIVGDDGCVRFANPAATAALALPADAAGRRLVQVVSDHRLAMLVETCLGSAAECTRELVDASGERHVMARAFPLDGARGPVTEVVVVLRDETRLRRLESVRRDFVANISHELRTPIAAIQLLVETLQEGALADPEMAPMFVSRIGLEVSHMSQMVSELLELSAIESGQLSVRVAPVPVTELLVAVERLRPLADERQLELRDEIAPDTPLVLCDATRLGQVMRNLVHNAIKFTPPGGRITVTAGPGDGDRVRLTVCDTGVGIAPEDQRRIFERFWKADRSRQRDGEGTGLGLAIARHVVEAHGGRITVDSVPDEGATFTVELPAAVDTN
jgi:two-component system phosphate regulon sensor histidine kinase PhoR